MSSSSKTAFLLLIASASLAGCSCAPQDAATSPTPFADSTYIRLADEVKQETLRSWKAYKQYAWGHDALKPLTKSAEDWYEHPLFIAPIDAYSTLKLMGFDAEAKEIENYVVDSLSWDKDVDAKVFAGVKKFGSTLLGANDEIQLNKQLGFVLEEKILLEKE